MLSNKQWKRLSVKRAEAVAAEILAAAIEAGRRGEHVVVRYNSRVREALTREGCSYSLQRNIAGDCVLWIRLGGEGWVIMMEGGLIAPSETYPYAA